MAELSTARHKEIQAKAHQRRTSGWIPMSAKIKRRKRHGKRGLNKKNWLRWRERNSQ